MPMETMRLDRLLVVVRVTSRQLHSFPAKGWVAVEVFTAEADARARIPCPAPPAGSDEGRGSPRPCPDDA